MLFKLLCFRDVKLPCVPHEVLRYWFVEKWQCNFPKETRVRWEVFFSERWWNGDLNFDLCSGTWNLRRQVAQIVRDIRRARNSMSTSRYKEEMYFTWTSLKIFRDCKCKMFTSTDSWNIYFFFHNWRILYGAAYYLILLRTAIWWT